MDADTLFPELDKPRFVCALCRTPTVRATPPCDTCGGPRIRRGKPHELIVEDGS